MKSIIYMFTFIASLSFVDAQKMKVAKYPVRWMDNVPPKLKINEEYKANKAILETNYDPLTFGDKINLGSMTYGKSPEEKASFMERAKEDTLKMLTSKNLELNNSPFKILSNDVDFTTVFKTNDFKINNVQLDIDYNDPEAILGQINITGRLTVTTKDDEIILNEEIQYFLEGETEEDKTTELKLKYFLLDPLFKTKLKLAKKPEKKEKILKNKMDNFEADILEVLVEDAGEVLRDNITGRTLTSTSAIFGIKKDAKYEEITILAEEVKTAINSLNAFSEKKRKTLDEIKPILEGAREKWLEVIPGNTDPFFQSLMYANLSTASALLGELDKAIEYMNAIPEDTYKKGFIVEGSEKYFMRELDSSLKTLSNYSSL